MRESRLLAAVRKLQANEVRDVPGAADPNLRNGATWVGLRAEYPGSTPSRQKMHRTSSDVTGIRLGKVSTAMPDIRKENSDRMKDVSSSYDFVIVCTNNEKQCAYWQSRLDDARGSVLAESATVIAVRAEQL